MSIAKIAKKVGVSYVTVSRALNCPEKVNPETLARIRRACQETNFKPRVIPSRIRTINLIVPAENFYNPADSVIINHLVNLIRGRNYHVIISPLSSIDKLPGVFLTLFIAFMHQGDAETLAFIRQYAAIYPFIVIDDSLSELETDAILIRSDHAQGTALALNYFLARGHRKIGYIGRHLNSKGYRERFNEYKRILEKQGLFNEAYVFINEDKYLLEGVKRFCEEELSAVFVAEAHQAGQVQYFLRFFNKEIPRDISLISIDFSGEQPSIYPPATAVIQPVRQLAELTVEKALEIMENPGHRKSKTCHLVPYELVERESVRTL